MPLELTFHGQLEYWHVFFKNSRSVPWSLLRFWGEGSTDCCSLIEWISLPLSVFPDSLVNESCTLLLCFFSSPFGLSSLLSFKGSWDSKPDVECAFLNSSGFSIEIFFCTSGCDFSLSHQNQHGRLGEILCQQDRKQRVRLGSVEENNSRSWCGHRKDRVRKKHESGWWPSWSAHTSSSWRSGAEGWVRAAWTEVWAVQWVGCARHQENFLRLRASWALPVVWELMINTLHAGPSIVHSISLAEPWSQYWAHFCQKHLQDEWSGYDLHLAPWAVLISCSQMQTVRTCLGAGDS